MGFGFSLSTLGTLEPHLSGLLWTAMLISLAIVIALPKPHGIRALIASTILRLIFSVGLQPTLFLLGAFNVSIEWAFSKFSCVLCKGFLPACEDVRQKYPGRSVEVVGGVIPSLERFYQNCFAAARLILVPQAGAL